MPVRSGFSLIEALVALVLFDIAALALIATTTMVTRDLSIADRHARAYAMATDRVARLRPAACGSASSGSADHAGGLREQWSVEAIAMLRVIRDSVVLPPQRGRTGGVAVEGWEVCPP